MIKSSKVVVFDVDGTLSLGNTNDNDYSTAQASQLMKAKLKLFKAEGYWIILYTSRNMRTYEGNIGSIIKHTAPILIKWLADYDIPYDELHFGKPWCGQDGFYVDDRAIRPREFLNNSIEQIYDLLKRDSVYK